MTTDILMPREQQFITNSAKQMVTSLKSTPFTSPLQAGLYGGGAPVCALRRLRLGARGLDLALLFHDRLGVRILHRCLQRPSRQVIRY
jgi:hypothetical protein